MKMRKYGGFTLIELMVTLSIAAILLGVGVPSLDNLLKNSQLQATSSKLHQSINYAREEAIKRRKTVELRSIGNDWDNGWQVFYITTGSAELLREYSSESQVEIIADKNIKKIIFNSQGFLTSGAEFDLTVGAEYSKRKLEIARSGQVGVTKIVKGVDGSDNNNGGGNG